MKQLEFKHKPVLLNECIEGLNIQKDGIYVDGTLGGAGHSKEIAKKLSENGLLIGIDRDEEALKAAKENLSEFKNVKYIHGNHDNIKEILEEIRIEKVDGILLDLGVSSYQLDERNRGFSYLGENELDMRMDKTQDLTAKMVVNTYKEEDLANIIYEYGEEKFSRQIAAQIVAAREIKPIETTTELAELIKKGVPAKMRREKNPCKKTFQAIRIAVNDELNCLSSALETAFASLNPGGRLVILTFHSLEDRIVKQAFAKWCTGCICPPEFPVCVCGHKPEGRLLHRKPLTATAEELARNPRSHSAKLRSIEKL